MTREECIKRLEYTKLRMKDATYSPETQEALDMAINSLKGWYEVIDDISHFADISEVEKSGCEYSLKVIKKKLDAVFSE